MEKTRILVVNDTQEILDTFQSVLQEDNYDVILSSFPFKNVKEIEKINPDLIILDFLFGSEGLGWQMLQLLKMHRLTASIPVIVCTAAVHQVQEQEGYLISRGVRVIYKPFDVDDLLDTVKQALSSYKHGITQTDLQKIREIP